MTAAEAAAHFAGGCLCGAVRFAAKAAPLWVGHCHCTSCRRAAGAPLMTWVGFAEPAFTYTATQPTSFASSPGVLREFCGRCGTPLSYRADRFPGEVHIGAATLDDPDRVTPTFHVWTGEQLSWLHLTDHLTRYPAGSGRAAD